MCSFFFWNDGIVLDRSVRSRERIIVPQEQRPALVDSPNLKKTSVQSFCAFREFENKIALVFSDMVFHET